jgi:MFS family permease
MYYSTDILSAAFPSTGPYISLGVAVVNLLMTIPPIFTIERYGHRKLLILSFAGILASLIVLGFALNAGWMVTSSIATLSFVSAFAMGLGPIPFVIIPEVSPLYVSSLQLCTSSILNGLLNAGRFRTWLHRTFC